VKKRKKEIKKERKKDLKRKILTQQEESFHFLD
jgi:hypothetical protein